MCLQIHLNLFFLPDNLMGGAARKKKKKKKKVELQLLRLVLQRWSEAEGQKVRARVQNPSTQTPRPLSTSVRFTNTTWKDNASLKHQS